MTDNKEDVNWSRFGLDPVGRKEPSPPQYHRDQSSELKAVGSTASGNPNVKDLFDEEQVGFARNERNCSCCQFHFLLRKLFNHMLFIMLNFFPRGLHANNAIYCRILKGTKRFFLAAYYNRRTLSFLFWFDPRFWAVKHFSWYQIAAGSIQTHEKCFVYFDLIICSHEGTISFLSNCTSRLEFEFRWF